jgi:hypothetical protein
MQSPVVVDFAQGGGDAGDDESGLRPFISNRPVIRLAENNASKSNIASKNRRRRLIHARHSSSSSSSGDRPIRAITGR